MSRKIYIEVPEFEMIIQLKNNKGLAEYKRMIKDNEVQINIIAKGLKSSMSDEELCDTSSLRFNINYHPSDDLIGENGVKAEILDENQVKINVSPFIYKFTPRRQYARELRPQIMDLESLFEIRAEFPGGGKNISSNLRTVTHKWKALDYSSDENPLPEIEYVDKLFFTGVYAIDEESYLEESKKYDGSIKKMREN
tara:strand:- start:21 stop:608 length:588 start_codon:yes stop_codon:yes gene_type:complete